jgi:hypothetical protein
MREEGPLTFFFYPSLLALTNLMVQSTFIVDWFLNRNKINNIEA